MKNVLFVFMLCITSPIAVIAEDKPVQQLKIGRMSVGRILYLGNSITLHGPAPQIGWTGNFGMAASAEDKDYVHLLTAEIAKSAGARPEIMVRNIADFERGYESYVAAEALKKELEFRPDLVVVAIGENVAELKTEEDQTKYAAAFAGLLRTLKQSEQTEIFVRTSFWANQVKDDIMRKAASGAGATLVDLAKYSGDPSLAASAERKIEHAGVAAHPGDKGMKAIADAIFAAMKGRAKMKDEQNANRN